MENTGAIAQAGLLPVQALTRAAFAPFGDVIEFEGRNWHPINDGMAHRYHDLAQIDVAAEGGRPLFNLLRAEPNKLPLDVRFVERHPHSSQAFFPLGNNPFLVVVAPEGDHVSPGSLRAFVTNGRQGINYRRAIWHHVLIVPRAAMEFVVVDRGGPDKNCDEFWFAPESVLRLDY